MSGQGEGHRGSRMPQNVKPKPGQPAPTQKDRPQKARRSRSSDSERGRRRERHHSDRHRRGRSEETRHRRDGKDAERRDTPPMDLLGDTECAVCFSSYDNVFKTPKLLACGHTFCLECLARINVTSPEIKTLSCPVCRVLTELPRGRDLPRLGNNQDVIGRLPAEMRHALSIRFQRSKGRLLLKHPPPAAKSAAISLPVKKHQVPPAAVQGGELAAAEEGGAPPTMVDVGRPPSRMRGRMRLLFHSDRCYYAVVASIITITVALMMVGILAFIIVPRVTINTGPGRPGGNFTGSSSQESSENFGPNSP
ncbi:E3 ubiquitin-protein ligase RNF183 [Poeciliopsis prolifica]|uniref:E3 ubiquitin-protein ligase RNF183 n=1 Tax=Poeciliopsis prolifica TaxID=188132 RepID=UPI002413F52B|nr:E3 ubiquitin-protein ligase RNF183 [Poeciliopsis prolifica]